MGSVSIWIGVKGGSVLKVSVRGKKATDVNFIADARVVPAKGAETLVPDHKLNPGPYSLKIRDGMSYAVRLAVKFLGSTTQRAVITAELVDPAGVAKPNVDGDSPYVFEVSGKLGQPTRRCTLAIQRAFQGAPHG